MFKTADQSLLNNNRHILLKCYTRKKRRETINYVYVTDVTVDLIVGDPVYRTHELLQSTGNQFTMSSVGYSKIQRIRSKVHKVMTTPLRVPILKLVRAVFLSLVDIYGSALLKVSTEIFQ